MLPPILSDIRKQLDVTPGWRILRRHTLKMDLQDAKYVTDEMEADEMMMHRSLLSHGGIPCYIAEYCHGITD